MHVRAGGWWLAILLTLPVRGAAVELPPPVKVTQVIINGGAAQRSMVTSMWVKFDQTIISPPGNAFTLWKPEAVTVTQGEDQIGEYNANERSYRQWCQSCGGHLMTRHPQWGLVDVFAATIPEFPFEPGVHVNYASTVLPMKDGLPKLKDFPTELGGTGESVPE